MSTLNRAYSDSSRVKSKKVGKESEDTKVEDNKVEQPEETTTEMTQPIIVNLGTQKPKNIKDLKKGEGELWDEVLNVVDEVKEMLGEKADGKVIIPIVMVFQKKNKRQRLDKMIFSNLKALR